METWRLRDLGTGRLGDLETGRLGDLETWRLGDLETGRLGDVSLKEAQLFCIQYEQKALFFKKRHTVAA